MVYEEGTVVPSTRIEPHLFLVVYNFCNPPSLREMEPTFFIAASCEFSSFPLLFRCHSCCHLQCSRSDFSRLVQLNGSARGDHGVAPGIFALLLFLPLEFTSIRIIETVTFCSTYKYNCNVHGVRS